MYSISTQQLKDFKGYSVREYRIRQARKNLFVTVLMFALLPIALILNIFKRKEVSALLSVGIISHTTLIYA